MLVFVRLYLCLYFLCAHDNREGLINPIAGDFCPLPILEKKRLISLVSRCFATR